MPAPGHLWAARCPAFARTARPAGCLNPGDGRPARRRARVGKKDELSAAELRYFTDLDHRDHEALGAVSPAGGRGVGVARYVRDSADPQTAEIAITIVDDWQGRGLGTELLAQLSSRARRAGIRRFTALVAADNAAMAGLLCNASASLVRREAGAVEYEIALATGEEPPGGKGSDHPLAPLLG